MKNNHKYLFLIGVLLAVISWSVAFAYWDKLPSVIPVHFGIDGQANGFANKSLFYVYLIPGIQTLMLGMFAFLYYKPQYSNIPSTMWLMALNKKDRDTAFSLIRTMLSGMVVLMGVIFTYISFAMNNAALTSDQTLSPVILITLLAFMLAWVIYWAVKVYGATKKAVKNVKK